MKKATILFVLFVGCQLEYGDYSDAVFTVPRHGFESVAEVVQWTAANIRYTPDDGEYWQTPEQTYNRRAGDCEDFALLAMYMINRELGIEPMLVLGRNDEGRHAWLSTGGWWEPHWGYWWEPQAGVECDGYAYSFWDFVYIDYGEAMYRAVETKRSLTDGEE